MSDSSKIEWCDATWNPVRGCVKVSPGCSRCYAEVFAERWRGVPGHPYEQGFDLRLVPEKLAEPLSWKKPRRVFVNSMSDLFQDGVPDAFIDQAFAAMALAPEHTFQVLTKRADRMRAYLSAEHRHAAIVAAMDMPSWLPAGRRFLRVPENWPMPNVWLGVSVENQHFADERIPLLCDTPATVRFISAEPLLGPVDLQEFVPGYAFDMSDHPMMAPLSWVIVGGESGSGARPFNIEWARHMVVQSQASRVPVFVKQLGANWYDAEARRGVRGSCVVSVDTPWTWVKAQSKGGDLDSFTPDLRVREFPEVRA